MASAARQRTSRLHHAVPLRCLKGRPPASDLFGVKSRRWLSGLELPLEERETVDCAMRQVEFLDQETGEVTIGSIDGRPTSAA